MAGNERRAMRRMDGGIERRGGQNSSGCANARDDIRERRTLEKLIVLSI